MNIENEIAILKQEFLDESLEMIEECEKLFLDLEENPTETNVLVDKVFRLAHTIKGSSLAVGFSELSNFSHDFESLLDRIGCGDIEISNSIVDLLLESNDTLKDFVVGLKNDLNFQLETSSIQERILGLIGHENSAKK